MRALHDSRTPPHESTTRCRTRVVTALNMQSCRVTRRLQGVGVEGRLARGSRRRFVVGAPRQGFRQGAAVGRGVTRPAGGGGCREARAVARVVLVTNDTGRLSSVIIGSDCAKGKTTERWNSYLGFLGKFGMLSDK